MANGSDNSASILSTNQNDYGQWPYDGMDDGRQSSAATPDTNSTSSESTNITNISEGEQSDSPDGFMSQSPSEIAVDYCCEEDQFVTADMSYQPPVEAPPVPRSPYTKPITEYRQAFESEALQQSLLEPDPYADQVWQRQAPISSEDPTFTPSAAACMVEPFVDNPISQKGTPSTLGEFADGLINSEVKPFTDRPVIVVKMGSFEGYQNPETPINYVEPGRKVIFDAKAGIVDKKPDVLVIVKDINTVIDRKAKYFGWDAETTAKIKELAKRGMVYFNVYQGDYGPYREAWVSEEVAYSPGVTKDTNLSYLWMRLSLLPDSYSFDFINHKGSESEAENLENRQRFFDRLKIEKVHYMGLALATNWNYALTGDTNVDRWIDVRYARQFRTSEIYRVFDWFKGAKQREKYEEKGEIAELFAPILANYLRRADCDIQILDENGRALGADEVTEENFNVNWRIVSKKGVAGRGVDLLKAYRVYLEMNKVHIATSKRNGKSTKASPGKGSSGFLYVLRKVLRFFGLGGDPVMPDYSKGASFSPQGPEVDLPVNEDLFDELKVPLHSKMDTSDLSESLQNDIVTQLERWVANRMAEYDPATDLLPAWSLNQLLADLENNHLAKSDADQNAFKQWVEDCREGRANDRVARMIYGLNALHILNFRLVNVDPASLSTEHPYRQVADSEAPIDIVSPEIWRSLEPYLSLHLKQAIQAAEGFGNSVLAEYFSFGQNVVQRQSVRMLGEPLPDYHVGGRIISPMERPPIEYGAQGEPVRVVSPTNLTQDVAYLMAESGYNILPERIPEVIAAAAGVESPGQLGQISRERVTVGQVRQWLASESGQTYLRANEARLTNRFGNRLAVRGPAMAVGLGAFILTGEYLAPEVGIDARVRPHEVFAAATLMSHGAATMTNVGMEVLSRTPYHYTTVDWVRSGGPGGTPAMRWVYHSGRSAAVGWARGSLDAMGLPREAMRRNAVALGNMLDPRQLRQPGRAFVRLPGNAWRFGTRTIGTTARIAGTMTMGALTLPMRMSSGLITSQAADIVVSQWMFDLKHDNPWRAVIHTAGFMAPFGVEAFSRNGNLGVLERSSALRSLWGGLRVAAGVGFAGNLTYTAALRVQHSDWDTLWHDPELPRVLINYQRANRIESEKRSSVANLGYATFALFAPDLANYLGSSQASYDQADREMRDASETIERNAQAFLASTLVRGIGQDALDPNFYLEVDYSRFRGNSLKPGENLPIQDFQDRLADGSDFNDRWTALQGEQQIIAFLKSEFRNIRTDAEALALIELIGLTTVQKGIAKSSEAFGAMQGSLEELFNSDGKLMVDAGPQLLQHTLGLSEQQLLDSRKVSLLFRILQLQAAQSQAYSGELEALIKTAQQINLADDQGQLLETDYLNSAKAAMDKWRQAIAENMLQNKSEADALSVVEVSESGEVNYMRQ